MKKVDEFEPYDVICRIGSYDKRIVIAEDCDSYCLMVNGGMMKGGLSWVKKDNIEKNYVLLEKGNSLKKAKRKMKRGRVGEDGSGV